MLCTLPIKVVLTSFLLYFLFRFDRIILTFFMSYQRKRNLPVQAPQQSTPTSSIISPNKFQRTIKRGLKSPQQTNVNSEKSQSVLTQSVKAEEPVQRARIISRTNKIQREPAKSPAVESPPAAKIQTPARNIPKYQSKIPEVQQEPKVSPFKKEEVKSIPKVTPDKYSSRKMKTQSAIEQQKTKLKKSCAWGYVFNRLLKKRIQSTFATIRENKNTMKRKNVSESKCLLLCASQFAKRYEINCYNAAFEKFKMIAKKELKDQVSNENQLMTLNEGKGKQNIINILHFLQRNKMNEAIEKLKQKKNQGSHAAKVAFGVLNGFESRKIRSFFQILKAKSTLKEERKKYLLNFIASTHTSCIKQCQLKAIRKIEFCSIHKVKEGEQPSLKTTPQRGSAKVLSTPPSAKVSAEQTQLTKKVEKITAMNDKITEDIESKETGINQKKREHDIQVMKVKRSIQDLKHKKKKLERDVNEKKKQSQISKKKVETKLKTLGSNEFNNVSTKGEREMLLLQQVYAECYKINEGQLNSNLKTILRDNQIDVNIKPAIIQEWNLILQKSKLQKQIEIYETSILGSKAQNSDTNKVIQAVRQQNLMIKNMIRNFIKERYLWCEVQKFVSTVL